VQPATIRSGAGASFALRHSPLVLPSCIATPIRSAHSKRQWLREHREQQGAESWKASAPRSLVLLVATTDVDIVIILQSHAESIDRILGQLCWMRQAAQAQAQGQQRTKSAASNNERQQRANSETRQRRNGSRRTRSAGSHHFLSLVPRLVFLWLAAALRC
jgi:hypothetical protein